MAKNKENKQNVGIASTPLGYDNMWGSVTLDRDPNFDNVQLTSTQYVGQGLYTQLVTGNVSSSYNIQTLDLETLHKYFNISPTPPPPSQEKQLISKLDETSELIEKLCKK